MTCQCGRIKIGMELTENRNWNPDCEEHGIGSHWYESEGRAKFKEQNDRAVEMQKKAREAREAYKNGLA